MASEIIPLHRGKPVTRPLSDNEVAYIRDYMEPVRLRNAERKRADLNEWPGRHIVIGDPPVPMGFYIICLAIGFCMGAVIGAVS